MNEKNEVAIMQRPNSQLMSVAEVKEQVALIQGMLKDVMKKEVHYDVIPGCGTKPVLLKAGAEKIMLACRLGSEPEIIREYDGFDTHFHIRARIFDIKTGNTVTYGVGVGATNESKFAWRKAVCDEEFEATPETKRRIHYAEKRDQRGYKVRDARGNYCYEGIQQVRQNPADIINTVLKMATKRAEVDGCRKATACSDVFDQDIDEEHIANAVRGDEAPQDEPFAAPQQQAPAAQGANAETLAPDKEWKRLYAVAKNRGFSNDELAHILNGAAGVARFASIPSARLAAVETAIQQAEPGKVLAR